MKDVKGFIKLVTDVGEVVINIKNISEVIDYPYDGKPGVKIIMTNGNEYISTSWWMDEILSRIENAS